MIPPPSHGVMVLHAAQHDVTRPPSRLPLNLTQQEHTLMVLLAYCGGNWGLQRRFQPTPTPEAQRQQEQRGGHRCTSSSTASTRTVVIVVVVREENN